MKILNISLCCLFFFGIGCGVQKNEMMRITYTDQNNNRYHITETSFTYTPVTKKESSSGTYDGGEPVSKTITDSDFEKIHLLAEEIVGVSPKDVKREMMTSVLSISRNGAKHRVTLRKSDKRIRLEELLTSLKNTSE